VGLLDSKLNPLKKTFTFLLLGAFCFSSCRKEKNFFTKEIELPVTETCKIQKESPLGRSYTADSIVQAGVSQKFCGLFPLNSKNYWVYQDSIFTDGVFTNSKYDTLRYSPAFKSLTDGLVWWKSNIYAGIPDIMYSSDSSLFTLEDRFFTFGIKDVKLDISLFTGDSARYITSFEDAAARGRSLKIETALKTPAGSFSDYVYFEKNAYNYRKDQVFFKPGIGVLKYIQEKAPMGLRTIKLQQILTLVAFHIE
jgi:hypothetical protein